MHVELAGAASGPVRMLQIPCTNAEKQVLVATIFMRVMRQLQVLGVWVVVVTSIPPTPQGSPTTQTSPQAPSTSRWEYETTGR